MTKLNIAKSASIIGHVSIGSGSMISQGTILRSKDKSLSIGANSMILENSVLISCKDNPLSIGSKTVFGHKCIVLGAEIGNLCEIGNGVIILPGAKVGNGCIFGEGTLIPENAIVEDGSVVVGRPGRVIRKLKDTDKDMIKRMRNNDITISESYEKYIINQDKEGEIMGELHSYNNIYPTIGKTTVLHKGAEVTGNVEIGENSIIGSGVKIIGNSHGPVRIGNNVQILENTVLHLLPDNELIIEDNVIIGPGCIIHGTTIGEGSVIESGSIVCDYTKIGENCLVKTGSLVKQRDVFEDNAIIEGYTAKKTGDLSEELKKPEWAYD